MSRSTLILALSTAAFCLAAESAWADSSVVSSASNSASSTSGSVSDSIERSSHSSSGGEKVAAGDYKVIEVAEAAQRPGHLRLRLQALAPQGGEFVLTLPRQTADKGGVLATGAQVTVAQRPYGLEFSNTVTAQAFFLVLEDAWHRELKARPV